MIMKGSRNGAQENGQRKKEGTQAYQRIYEEMKQYVQIKFVKVKGHSNDKYNDYADMLAKSALGIGDGSFEKKRRSGMDQS